MRLQQLFLLALPVVFKPCSPELKIKGLKRGGLKIKDLKRGGGAVQVQTDGEISDYVTISKVLMSSEFLEYSSRVAVSRNCYNKLTMVESCL